MGPFYASRGEGSPLPPPANHHSTDSDPPCNSLQLCKGLDSVLPVLPSPCVLVRGQARADQQEVAYDVAFSGGMAAFASSLVGGEDALVELGIGAAERESVLTRELSARGRTTATIRAIPRALPEPHAWLIEFVDDTELVAHARDMRLRGQVLERLVETVPLAIAGKDPRDGFRFTLVNRYFEETFGIRRADVIGASDRDFFPPELCEKYRRADEAAIASESVVVLEEEINTAIGRRQARTIKIPLFDDQGRPELLLAIVQDVTDLRTAIRQAEQGRQVNSRILQGLGREMKARIAGLTKRLDVAGDDLDVAWIRNEALGLLSRIDEALDVSSLQARGGKSQAVAPLALVRAAVEASARESESRAVTWNVTSTLAEDGAEDARIDVSPQRLSRAIGHLISNAVQFSPRGAAATIRVGLDAGRDRLCISVEDEGIGIPEEEQQALFGAFFDSSRPVPESDDNAGCPLVNEPRGLGLTLCRQLVASMGGEIAVTSELGEGSAFTISLPWLRQDGRGSSAATRGPGAKVDPSAGAAHGAPPVGTSVPAARILLVEDNLLCQRIAVRHLESLGHSVTVAGDVFSAAHAYEAQGGFDFALIDERIEGQPGLGLIRRLRAMEGDAEEESHLPLIALFSGDSATDLASAEENHRLSIEAGADVCLSKPLRPETLTEVFQRLDRR